MQQKQLINMRFLFAQAEPTAIPTTHKFSTQPRPPHRKSPRNTVLGFALIRTIIWWVWHVLRCVVWKDGVMFPCYTLSLFLRLRCRRRCCCCLWLWFVWLTHSLSACKHRHLHTLAHTRTHIAAQAAAGNAPATCYRVYCLPPSPAQVSLWQMWQ